MNGFRIKNYRSFRDTKNIEISPITVFLGSNSSGKSSVIRSFPLIKQSCTQKISGPILWYGQYVDFGNFEDTIFNCTDEKLIHFSFDFSDENNHNDQVITVSIAKDGNNEVVTSTTLKLYDHKVIINLKRNSIESLVINDLSMNTESISFVYEDNNIIPVLKIKEDFGKTRNGYYYFLNGPFESAVSNEMLRLAIQLLRKYNLNNKIKENSLIDILIRVRLSSKENIIIDLLEKGKHLKSWVKFINKHKENIEFIEYFISLLVLSKMTGVTKKLSSNFTHYYLNTYYLAPLRATAEKYYRIANLSVAEVDHSGLNLAMFLKSLEKNEIKRFQEWTMDCFGFKAIIIQGSGHISINIQTTDTKDQRVNLTDSGFGYSQILPIITQLWVLANRQSEKPNRFAWPNAANSKTLIVEQPELHLHPTMQAELIRAFSGAIKLAEKNGIKLKIIMETHSKSIIDSLGSLVEKNEEFIGNISIYIVNKENGESYITKSYFNNDGFLENWPFGFFDVEA